MAWDGSNPAAVARCTQALSSGGGSAADVIHDQAFSPGMDARVAPYVTNGGVLIA